jgi:tRNA threonylcarbamoyl adenosine modification protein YjeE
MQNASSVTFTATDEQESESLGFALGRALAPGDVVALCGDLGAGKTTLTRAIARGAGVPPDVPVNSPTFTIVNLYDAPSLRICHLDLYRLGDSQELEAIGLDDLMADGTALVVEWFDLFPGAFDPDHLRIEIAQMGATGRRYTITAGGSASHELLEEFKREKDEVD